MPRQDSGAAWESWLAQLVVSLWARPVAFVMQRGTAFVVKSLSGDKSLINLDYSFVCLTVSVSA